MVDVVIGAGEVGTAIGTVLKESGRTIHYHDPTKGLEFDLTKDVDVLNICFPYSEEFVEQSRQYIKKFKPRLTIIHSTVAVGTTEQVGRDVVYSFVRGRHTEGIEKTIKIHEKSVGCMDDEKAQQAVSYLVSAGFTISDIYEPRAVELQKLVDTTYYGICIAATKMFKEMADYYGVEWQAISEGNKDYNTGVVRVGHPEWQRPVLEPTPGLIGGHCVVPNARILQKDFSHKLLEAIVEAK